MRILVVDDEVRIARSIKQGLEQDGYAVDVAHDGEDGYRAACAEAYDVIILDVMMPTLNGFEVAKKLRADGKNVPILMLTAKDQSRDIVTGLDSGADDYLAKPFSFEVLSARVRALLRRPQDVQNTVLSVRDLEMDVARHSVKRAGKTIALSNKEFGVLEYLLRNKNRVVSKASIIAHVWDFDADVLPNTVEVFITYVRKKIDKPFSGAPIIETVQGLGYRVKDE